MDNLPRIKELFRKIYNAYGWSLVHPQQGNEELWEKSVLPVLDKYYDELAQLGVPREFSMCLFCFGIDYLTAFESFIKE